MRWPAPVSAGAVSAAALAALAGLKGALPEVADDAEAAGAEAALSAGAAACADAVDNNSSSKANTNLDIAIILGLVREHGTSALGPHGPQAQEQERVAPWCFAHKRLATPACGFLGPQPFGLRPEGAPAALQALPRRTARARLAPCWRAPSSQRGGALFTDKLLDQPGGPAGRAERRKSSIPARTALASSARKAGSRSCASSPGWLTKACSTSTAGIQLSSLIGV